MTHLVASHCKPWRDSNNEERLVLENGSLLTPSIDHLFDKGFIGFEDPGRLIISPVAHLPSLQKMDVETEKPVSWATGRRKSCLPIFRFEHMRIPGVTLRHFEQRALMLFRSAKSWTERQLKQAA